MSYEKEVEAILRPFEHNFRDVRCQDYAQIMRGVLGCHPELRNNIELFDAISDEVARRLQVTGSKTFCHTLANFGK